MRPKIYIAAPFFNERQLRIVRRIERILDAYGFKYFSPRCLEVHPDLPAPKIEAKEAANGIFKANINAIANCGAMIAVLDYTLRDEDEHIRCVTLRDPGNPAAPFSINFGPPVHLPDVGTVFEIGEAHGRKLPIIGYTDHIRGPDARELNLMLTRAMRGVCYGAGELDMFVETANRNFAYALNELGDWEGSDR
jgi:nucleoside 2-deoxyribosyltransferase